MNTVIFATNNAHKLEEIRVAAQGLLQIRSLAEAGIHTEIPEPWPTLNQNAEHKCRFIYEMTGLSCFAEDSGLEVDALNGAPGVYSARYAGEPVNPARNITKLLAELNGVEARSARFRAVICYLENGKPHFFEGSCEGKIAGNPMGNNGFGYDPVFIPEGYSCTFAQMEQVEKINLSHRKKAFDKLWLFLKSNR